MECTHAVNKLVFLHFFFVIRFFNIVCITETWLTPFVLDKEVLPSDYKVYHRDRGTRGVGVLIVIIDIFPSHQVDNSNTSVQMLIVEVNKVPRVLVLHISSSLFCELWQELLNQLHSLNSIATLLSLETSIHQTLASLL